MGQIVLPIACSLEGSALDARTDDWVRLMAHAIAKRPVPGGVEITFDSSTSPNTLGPLIEAEEECCPWMSMHLSEDPGNLVLSISSTSPTGEQQIHDWFA